MGSRRTNRAAQAEAQTRRERRPRAVLYARVSSKEQDREGFSIPAQLKLLDDYATIQDFDIADKFIDIETAKESGRPNFSAMLSYLRKHPTVRVVLVEKTDRLYRNLKDWVTIDDLDLEIHFVKEGVILSGESRSSEKFMHGIKVLMAKNYIDNLSEEVRKGMIEKAEQGLWPSAAPMGYLNADGLNGKKIIVIDPKLGPLIQNLFEWYSTGQYSLKAVAKKAQAAGLAYRKSGVPLSVATVHKILRNRIYSGAFEWRGKIYKGSHDPLVSVDLWNGVQEVLDGRNASKIHGTVHDFPFSGLITCGHCGCALVGEVKKKKYTYYHCTGFKGKCGEPYVREEVLEERFKEVLSRLRFDDEVFAMIKAALHESLADESRERTAAIAKLRAEADRLQKRIEIVYIDKLDGKVSEGFYERMQFQWREERDRCLKDIERHHTADDSYLDTGIAMIKLAQEAHSLFESRSASERRNLLGFLLSNCKWANGELVADFNEPFDFLAETVGNDPDPEPGASTDSGEKENWLGN
ncbi:recombinase family protein [Brevundimonas aurantiaca]|uniref:recombinase family protein n=1 Tax=Brevundimonas aurantiaca TaxID=74316 RepID=UPI00174C628F|nr:recombinase family protein [Brevundimonas aurantiaca]